MKQILFYILLITMCACSGSNHEQAHMVSNEAEITALAEGAAERIAYSDHSDTLAMQEAIMDARAQHSALVIAGNKDGAKTYDEALRNRLMKLDAQLCDSIFEIQQ